MIRLFTDSGSDLNLIVRNTYCISLLPFSILLNDIEYLADWEKIDQGDFKEAFQLCNPPKPSRPSLAVWKEEIEKYVAEGYDILYVAMSQKMTSSLKMFETIKCLLKEEGKIRDNQQLIGLDSRTTGAAQGLVTLKIADWIAAGKKIDEIQQELLKLRTEILIAVTNTEATNQSGRVEKVNEEDLPAVFQLKDGFPKRVYTAKNREDSINFLISQIKTAEIICELDPTALNTERYAKDIEHIVTKLPSGTALKIQSFGPSVLASMGANSIGIAWLI